MQQTRKRLEKAEKCRHKNNSCKTESVAAIGEHMEGEREVENKSTWHI